MAAAHQKRIERLDRIVEMLPSVHRDKECPDTGWLLERLTGDLDAPYGADVTAKAARRMIQRDLEELVRVGRIAVANPGAKPLRYRRVEDDDGNNPWLTDYVRKIASSLVLDVLPTRGFDALWRRVRDPERGLALGDDRIRVITDTQRLIPAEINPGVLAAVLEGLASTLALTASYRDRENKTTRPLIHPQGLLQRGPRLYLFALKNEETDIRMYALHRFTSCSVSDAPARQVEGFNLDDHIARGQADFATGKRIRVVLRARRYVADLLRECPLAEGQRIDDELEDSAFEARVEAEVVSSGQLLRWLLGCGDNVEVLEPAELRTVVAAQAVKMAGIYSA